MQPPPTSWMLYWWERRGYLQYRLRQKLSSLVSSVIVLLNYGASNQPWCIIWSMIYYPIYFSIYFGYLKFIVICLADMSVNLRCVYTCILLPLLIFTFLSPSEVRWYVRVIVFLIVIVILDMLIFVGTLNWNALLHHQVGMLFCDYQQSIIGNSFRVTSAVYFDIHQHTYNYLNKTLICTFHANSMVWCLGVITLPLLALYSSINDILYVWLKIVLSIPLGLFH